MGRSLWAACVLLLGPATAAARNADTRDSASYAGRGSFARFGYANDFFSGTDYYHTQGLSLDVFDPALKVSPLMRVLAGLPGAESDYGLLLRHSGFTPTSLSSDAARVGDRPFAAVFFLGHARVSRDPARRLTLTTELHTGVIGQGAGGKWMQKGIHRALGSLEPRGWDNQVRNDAVLGYYARLEKGAASARAADLGAYADATLGTLYVNAAAGLAGRLGALGRDGGPRLFLFARVEEKLVGYDATLRGGMLNRRSPHTLGEGELRRAVFRGDIGAVLERGSLALEITRAFVGREFRTGLSHRWIEIALLKRF